MEEDKHIRAAIFSILYRNLITGLRIEKKIKKQPSSAYSQIMEKREEYVSVLEAVLADGIVGLSPLRFPLFVSLISGPSFSLSSTLGSSC